MSKLWQKKENTLDKDIEAFEVGQDYLLDLHLAPFDIYGSAAHARMLQKIGILTQAELDAILKGLHEIQKSIEKGEFKIAVADEDVHTKVENILVQTIGDAGKKLHTARSRNDQVLLDTRLYSKYRIQQIASLLLELCSTLLSFAQRYEFIPMPGYTHMQIAMPSSIGLWASAFVESILDELKLFEGVAELNDMNPLGSGAAYGVGIDIDRELTTELLGFDRVQSNVLYCGNGRGKIEAHILNSLGGFALILNRLATDLLIFTTKEFQFFTFTEAIATGSSIMPQKRNLDVMELIRSRTHVILGNESQIKHIIANLPSGYNRDYQDTKKLLIESFATLEHMIKVSKIVFLHLKPNEERLKVAMLPEIYATDAAYRLVKKGKPFRDAYRHVGTHLEELDKEDAVSNIKSKKHIGATGNLELPKYGQKIFTLKELWQKEAAEYQATLEKLF
jgi:argininosuccinate lyase